MYNNYLCITCSVIALTCSNYAVASPLNNISHTYTQHTLELKPISNLDNALLTAAAVFLPDATDSENNWGTNKIEEGYSRGDCNNKSSLFTTKTCSYPKTIVASSKCSILIGYYRECACQPQFKLSSCPSPKYASSPSCDGKFESCLCPATVELINPNDKCTQYCDGKCITKTCSPTPSETGCSYGTIAVTDNCSGTRNICKACNLSPCSAITSKPANSYYTTSSCTDCGGTKNINSGWECNFGYIKSGNNCVSNSGCPNGFVKMDNLCVNPGEGDNPLTAEKCKSMGYSYIWGDGSNGCGGHYQKYYIVPEWNCPYNISYGKRGCGVCSDIHDDYCYSSHAANVDFGKGTGRTDFHWFGEKCSWAN